MNHGVTENHRGKTLTQNFTKHLLCVLQRLCGSPISFSCSQFFANLVPSCTIHRLIQWIDKGIPIRLYGDGSQSRDFTYVDDIAKGTIAAMRPLGHQIINLGGGNNPIEINAVIEKIEQLLGKKAIIEHLPMHKADMISTWADIGKAKSILDWQPAVSLSEGLELCVNWYRENLPWSSQIDLGTTN